MWAAWNKADKIFPLLIPLFVFNFIETVAVGDKWFELNLSLKL